MKFIAMVSFGLTFSFGMVAHAEVEPLGVALAPSSSCSQVDLAMAAIGDGVAAESYEVTTNVVGGDIHSGLLPSSLQSLNGGFQRSIIFENALPSASLVAVSYRIGSQGLPKEESSDFFVVYSCSTPNPLYTCYGSAGECPTELNGYLPQVSLNRAKIQFRKSWIPGDTVEPLGDFQISNAGIIPLTVKLAVVGSRNFVLDKDYKEFVLNNIYPSTIVISHHTTVPGNDTAELQITTNDPHRPSFVVPLSAETIRRPQLKCDIKYTVNGNAVDGSIRVRNIGNMPSRKSSVKVTMKGMYDDESKREVLVDKKLGSLKQKGIVRYHFRSSGHDFSNGVGNKIILGAIAGSVDSAGSEGYRICDRSVERSDGYR